MSDDKKSPFDGGQTMRAWKLKKEKRKDVTEVRKVYEEKKSFMRKLKEGIFGVPEKNPLKDPGAATMIGQKVLKDKGYSTQHAADLMKEVRGHKKDHITPKMISQVVTEVEGKAIKPNEVALILRGHIPNYERGMIVRYQGKEFMPMRVRRMKTGILYHMKRCR
ncbi:MAG: hypothetical protein ACYTGH_10675 [Planctomycetota bacterium]|jgi:hypothetical protein